MKRTRIALAMALSGALAGGSVCATASSPGAAGTRAGGFMPSGPVPVALPRAEGASKPPDLQAIVDAARADAASRRGIAGSSVVVIVAEPVVWSDGSLGCPVPGAAYTMALVPGFRVLVRAGETMLDYHAGGRGMILCPPALAVDPTPVQRR
jgi:hypothetical protein